MIEILPSDSGVGAEVRGVDLGKGLDDGTFAEIRDAWHEHLVLLFREQAIDDESLVDIGRHFGTLEQSPRSEVSAIHMTISGTIVMRMALTHIVPIGSIISGSDASV